MGKLFTAVVVFCVFAALTEVARALGAKDSATNIGAIGTVVLVCLAQRLVKSL